VWTIKVIIFKEAWMKVNTVELHLPGWIGVMSQQDNWIFFIESTLHWRFEVGKISTHNCCELLHIYVCISKTCIIPYMYLTVGGKNLNHKKMSHNYSMKMFTQRAKPIHITIVWISWVLLHFFIYILFLPLINMV